MNNFEDELKKFMNGLSEDKNENVSKKNEKNEKNDELMEELKKVIYDNKFVYEQSLINSFKPSYEDAFFKMLMLYIAGSMWREQEDKGKSELEKLITNWKVFVRKSSQKNIEHHEKTKDINLMSDIYSEVVKDGEDLRLLMNKALLNTENGIRKLFENVFDNTGEK